MRTNIFACFATLLCVAVAQGQGQPLPQYDGFAEPYANHPVSDIGCCDCGEAACGCEQPAATPLCGCESTPQCGCENSHVGCEVTCGTEMTCEPGCDDMVSFGPAGCDSCGSGGCSGKCPLRGLMSCDSGDEPFSLFGSCGNLTMGGWLQLGYFNKGNTLFNSYPDNLQLQQAWLYAEKAIDTSEGFDVGGRIDYLYGTDSQDTQAFGTNPRGWDNPWDNGPDYGHAIPQLYVEAGYGDLSVKAGHFYTIIGWEVVQATGNFFYSHAYTMYNSEPFTHTGALATYAPSDDVTVWGGYTLGWDSGFDDNGDNFLGGLSFALCEDVTLIYATTIGRFGALPLGTPEKGYMHSIVADVTLTEKLQYIFQSDLLDSEDDNNNTVRDTFGINQYMIYNVNDTIALGGRFEWYQNEGVYTDIGQTADIYELTLGVNVKPHANITVRPEIRWDWVDNNAAVLAAGNQVLEDGDDNQTTFAIDTILTF